jgi:RNA polymerase-binding transcription factor DksA
MNQKSQTKYRNRLEALQDRLREVGTAVADQARGLPGGGPTGELSGVPLHLADRGTEEYLQDMNMLLAANEGQLAEEVREAMLRLENGTFGKCENCGQAIANERLDALPYARYCMKCAQEMEATAADGRSNFNAGRPRRPDDTIAPEGEMDEGGTADDVHAAGTAGGGTSLGGLAGSNRGRGEPDVDDLQDAAGSSNADAAERHVRRRGRGVQPVDYESDEDRARYAERTQEVE